LERITESSGGAVAEKICVTIKLYSGLDREIPLSDYNREQGIALEIKRGTRLRKVLKSIGMKNLSYNAYFLKGVRIGLCEKIVEDSEVACIKPAGGG
jgi:hypothetical protein